MALFGRVAETYRDKGNEMEQDVRLNDRVTYQDMANPRREGTVTEIKTSRWGTEYRVTWDKADDGFTWTDLRQPGWTHTWHEHPV